MELEKKSKSYSQRRRKISKGACAASLWRGQRGRWEKEGSGWYEDEAGKTFVAYDNFVSLLAQYQREEITQVAQIVEQKLEALLAAVTR